MSLGEHVQAWAIGVLLVAGKCHVVTSVKLMKIETPKEQSDIQTSLQVSKKRLYYASNIVTFIEKGNFGDTMCEKLCQSGRSICHLLGFTSISLSDIA